MILKHPYNPVVLLIRGKAARFVTIRAIGKNLHARKLMIQPTAVAAAAPAVFVEKRAVWHGCTTPDLMTLFVVVFVLYAERKVANSPQDRVFNQNFSQAGPLLEGSACEFERNLTSVKNFAIIIL